MANITTCSECGRAYEESSEEAANAPYRQCWHCQMNERNDDKGRPHAEGTET